MSRHDRPPHKEAKRPHDPSNTCIVLTFLSSLVFPSPPSCLRWCGKAFSPSFLGLLCLIFMYMQLCDSSPPLPPLLLFFLLLSGASHAGPHKSEEESRPSFPHEHVIWRPASLLFFPHSLLYTNRSKVKQPLTHSCTHHERERQRSLSCRPPCGAGGGARCRGPPSRRGPRPRAR